MSLIGDGYAGLAIFYNPSKFCIKSCNFSRPDRNEISTPIGAWKCNRSNNYFEIPKRLWRSICRYMYIKYSILVILVLREKSIFSCVMFMIIHIARVLSLRFVAKNYEFNHVFWTFFFFFRPVYLDRQWNRTYLRDGSVGTGNIFNTEPTIFRDEERLRRRVTWF